MRISDWSSDVCSSDLAGSLAERGRAAPDRAGEPGAGPAFRRGRRKHRLHSRLGTTAMQRNLRFKLTAALSLALATAACAADPERSKEAQAIADTINVAFHRSEEHTSELQSLMRISYAVFCWKKKKKIRQTTDTKRKQVETR